ncbi:MAG: VCBS repeat-containing protein [Chitinophagaceae bacterium]|nr:VCBS repeat-containing protein [Chitinophagaceae bacterium]
MLVYYLLFHLFSITQPAPANFEEQVIDDNISIGYGIALGDVDGDKKTDILLADKKQIVWYRNGDWKKFVIAENLTESDNVCIAARDLNNDGKVEVAVGAQWNPGETSDDKLSGAVFYLNRPGDINQPWEPIRLHHEPTVHRMRWVKDSKGKYFLVMLPLHGRGNKNGEGAGVNVIAYEFPKDVHSKWNTVAIADEMHMTHNMAVKEQPGKKTEIYVAGKEGVKVITEPFTEKKPMTVTKIDGNDHASGEIKLAKNFIATIQPMHGNKVSVYPERGERIILDSSFADGHAIGVADFLGVGYEQVVAGWRNPNSENFVGIKLYTRKNANSNEWTSQWVDKNGMACEDLQVMDMNADGKPDIIAAGRSTKNLKIYWNR